MKKLVDGRGLACPQPVIKTKNALESGNFSELEVIVDNKPASQNVKRFAENTGNTVISIQEKNGFFHVIIQPGIDANSKNDGKPEKMNCLEGKIIFITSNKLGKGNNQLGELLMTSFIYTLTELKCKPQKIIFMNSGVKLTIENSQALDNLQILEKDTEILVCGTCLDFFGLKNKLAVGRISNMYEIAETLTGNNKVLTF